MNDRTTKGIAARPRRAGRAARRREYQRQCGERMNPWAPGARLVAQGRPAQPNRPPATLAMTRMIQEKRCAPQR
jgi:hypothetical protein